MKKILVPTDFSNCANNAARNAVEISKSTNAEIHFLHFMSIPISWVHTERHPDIMYPDIEKKVAEATDSLKELTAMANDAGITASYQIDFNDDKNSLNKYIDQNAIDIIVMGSHGSSGMKELFVGSNAQKVIRKANIPVLIVKEKINHFIAQNLVFVSDFEAEAMKPFQQVLHIAELLHAKVHLLYINTPAYFDDTWSIKNKMETFQALASKQLESSSICCDFVFEEGVQKYCDQHQIDVTAIATHGRNGFSKILLGSDAERVVNHLTTPVLSLHY